MTTSITSNVAGVATTQQTLILEEKEQEQQVSVFVVSSSGEADDIQERVASNRLKSVASTAYEDAQAKSDNGKKWVAGGTIGAAVGVIGTIAACIFTGGWGLLGLAVVAGGGGSAWYGSAQVAEGEREMNQANRLSATASNEQYTPEPVEGLSEQLANTFYGNDDHSYMTPEQLTRAAQDIDTNFPLEGGQYSKNIYVVNPEADGKTQVAELHVVDIDSGSFDGRTVKDESQDPLTGEKRGYNKEVYQVEQEYGSVLANFVEQSSEDGKMRASTSERLVGIAQALETKDVYRSNTENEDTAFFDVTGDGYINLADLTMLQYGEEVKNLLEATGEESWNESNFYNIMKKINPELDTNSDSARNQLKAKYDVNGDGVIDDKDKEFFIKSALKQASPDINNDGVVNNKDAIIMESYLKANMLRVKNAENTIAALNDITGGSQTVDKLFDAMGLQ